MTSRSWYLDSVVVQTDSSDKERDSIVLLGQFMMLWIIALA